VTWKGLNGRASPVQTCTSARRNGTPSAGSGGEEEEEGEGKAEGSAGRSARGHAPHAQGVVPPAAAPGGTRCSHGGEPRGGPQSAPIDPEEPRDSGSGEGASGEDGGGVEGGDG